MAIIVGMDEDDTDLLKAKQELYKDGKFNVEISHRTMSNNTIRFKTKPSFEMLSKQFDLIKTSAEPGFFNLEEAKRRFPDTEFSNPCSEILLKSRQVCNLTTLNLEQFIVKNDTDAIELYKIQELSARAGYRVTLLDLELKEWDEKQKEDRLTGVALSGIYDFINANNLNKEQYEIIFRNLRHFAVEANKEYAKQLGLNASSNVTTIKPSGTLSLFTSSSAGAHPQFASHYIRRIRISANSPLLALLRDKNYKIVPEVGQTEENANTFVVEFVVKAPEGMVRHNVTAKDQIDMYLSLMRNYCQQNVSITISVRPHEWEEVVHLVHDNWDEIVGLSFVEMDNTFYQLLPYEECTEEYYNKHKNHERITIYDLAKYEKIAHNFDDDLENCSSGACGVR